MFLSSIEASLPKKHGNSNDHINGGTERVHGPREDTVV